MRLAVLNIVGLSKSLIGPHTPSITKFAGQNGLQTYRPAFPAVTTTAQSSILTGTPPTHHGIVGNGWYDRETAEIRFWKQSNHIVQGEKIWETLRKSLPNATCAKLFWWYNMHSSADYTITPRPLYPADGSKHFDVHTQPMALRDEITRALGPFPFPTFWGPNANIQSSKWIGNSAQYIEEKYQPTLSLTYLPHLDYCLQKHGPDSEKIPAELRAIDALVGELIAYYQKRNIRVLLLSEYGISPVDHPIHLNRQFRKHGWLSIKNELGRETLDYGGCKVFAVADHQIAHIYIQEPSLTEQVRELLAETPGIDEVRQPDHPRAGDLIAIASPNSWFTYYFWENDTLAPDYARTIDIHRKPGYDPCELFIDPQLHFPKLRIAAFLLRKKLHIRSLLDVIPLNATLVKGSHGRDQVPDPEKPVLIGTNQTISHPEDIHKVILNHFSQT